MADMKVRLLYSFVLSHGAPLENLTKFNVRSKRHSSASPDLPVAKQGIYEKWC